MKFKITVDKFEVLDEVNKGINKDVPQDGEKHKYKLFFRLSFKTIITKNEDETDEYCYEVLKRKTTVNELRDAARRYGLSKTVIDSINESMLDDMIIFIE
jgi:hypothetical protein